MSQAQQYKQIVVYQNASGKEPFTDWLNSLRDPTTRQRILKRQRTLEQGHDGDVKPVGNSINEWR